MKLHGSIEWRKLSIRINNLPENFLYLSQELGFITLKTMLTLYRSTHIILSK